MDEASSSSNAELSTKMSKNYRIQVSRTKKPLSFYLNLAKKYVTRSNKIELAAMGMAIPSVIMISENFKESGLATQKSISISTVKKKDDVTGKFVQKAKMEIIMASTVQSDDQSKANEVIISETETKKNAQPMVRPKKAKQKTKETSHDHISTANCTSQDETVDTKDNVKIVDKVVGFVSLSVSSPDETVVGKTNLKNADKAEKLRLRNLQKELNRKLKIRSGKCP